MWDCSTVEVEMVKWWGDWVLKSIVEILNGSSNSPHRYLEDWDCLHMQQLIFHKRLSAVQSAHLFSHGNTLGYQEEALLRPESLKGLAQQWRAGLSV